MGAIKNMRELSLMKQKLQIKEELYEKELAGSTAEVIDNLTDKFRDLAFEFSMRLTSQLVTNFFRRKRKNRKKENGNRGESDE